LAAGRIRPATGALSFRWVKSGTGGLACGAPVRRRQAPLLHLHLGTLAAVRPHRVNGSLPAHETFLSRSGHALDFLSSPQLSKAGRVIAARGLGPRTGPRIFGFRTHPGCFSDQAIQQTVQQNNFSGRQVQHKMRANNVLVIDLYVEL
jgi:hypothetical protein